MCGKGKLVDMGTVLRSELSKKSKYWVERHRYYELKHFCLQYPIWKKAYLAIDHLESRQFGEAVVSKTNRVASPTDKNIEALLYYSDRMKLVEQAATAADPEIADYILKAVTGNIAYDHLKASLDIPCSKDAYYDLYRKFFWILSHSRK